jgi:catechol-2,3-dioxygenase
MISGVNHITLSVRNLDDSFLFYRDVLLLRPLAKRRNKSAYFLAGNDWIVLVENKNLISSSESYAHLALSVAAQDFDSLSKKIKSSSAEIWQDNSSPGESLYFKDPSGNKLEIHAGDWRSRLEWLRAEKNPDVEILE